MSNQQQFNPQHFIISGDNKQEKVSLTTSEGSHAEIYLHGAQLISWIPARGEERLFLSRSSNFGPLASIRGGVPVIFPQFCDEGPLLKHGFARRMDWTLKTVEQTASFINASFELSHTPKTLSIWPFNFLARLSFHLSNQQIKIMLTVTNSDTKPFSFTGALHTYFQIADIHETSINGLKNCTYFESVDRKHDRKQTEETLHFQKQIDRFYMGVDQPLTLCERQRHLTVDMSGFKDVVVWNPWIEQGAEMADLEKEGYLHFVCVEAALIEKPVLLAPAESWNGSQTLTA
jgi:glucose-6-phosphate 1-epimerase